VLDGAREALGAFVVGGGGGGVAEDAGDGGSATLRASRSAMPVALASRLLRPAPRVRLMLRMPSTSALAPAASLRLAVAVPATAVAESSRLA